MSQFVCMTGASLPESFLVVALPITARICAFEGECGLMKAN